MSADRWAFRAFLALYAVALLMIVAQLHRSGHAVQTVERDLGPVTVPADPLPCTDDVALKLAASRNPNIECAP